MVALDAVVEVLGRAMLNTWQDCAEGRGIALGFVRGDALRPPARLIDGTFKEGLGCPSIPAVREVGVHDLAVVVDRSINVRPRPVQPRVRFINAPLRTNWASVCTCSCAEQWQEALDPAIDGASVNCETTFRKPLHDVCITQTVAGVPTHSQGNHIIRKVMVGERAAGTGSKPAVAIVAAPALAAQSGLSVLARPLAPTPNALHGRRLLLNLRSIILLPI
jgi:hypothetical protein